MTTRADELMRQALLLSEDERAKIAAELIASLDESTDADANAAWSDEILRRADAIDRGAPVVEHDEAMRRLRAKLPPR